MYDKVKFFVDRSIIGSQYTNITSHLERAKVETDQTTGETRTRGTMNGLSIGVFGGGVFVEGSLPKYHYGSNIYPLDREGAKECIEMIGDTLGINMSGADVVGIEFGTTFIMQYKVSAYLAKLGQMPRLQRYNFNADTLYYKGSGKVQPRVYTFYDKLADCRAKKLAYPSDFEDKNLLRYEMRLKGRLAYQLGVPEVKASTLYDRQFYRELVRRYQDSYFSISKINELNPKAMKEIKNVSDAFNIFVARLLSQTEQPQSQIDTFINEIRAAGVFEDKKYYTRLKDKLNEIVTKDNITISNELIKELDDAIVNCGAYV